MHLIGPFKPYLAESISLQSSNCNILGLAATLAFFANEARFTQIQVFFWPDSCIKCVSLDRGSEWACLLQICSYFDRAYLALRLTCINKVLIVAWLNVIAQNKSWSKLNFRKLSAISNLGKSTISAITVGEASLLSYNSKQFLNKQIRTDHL